MVTYTGSGTNKKEKQTGWARRGRNGAVIARDERQNEVCNGFIDDGTAVGLVPLPVTQARVHSAVVPSREQPHIKVNVRLSCQR